MISKTGRDPHLKFCDMGETQMRSSCYTKRHSYVANMETLSLLISFLTAVLSFAGKWQRREGLQSKTELCLSNQKLVQWHLCATLARG